MFSPGKSSRCVNERCFVRSAVMAWIIFALVLATLLIVRPQRSLAPLYADASRQFWGDVVPTAEYRVGFYYLPVSQILYTPIAMAGPKLGGVVAQLISLALITWAAWELMNLLIPRRREFAFAIILLLLIPGTAGILRVVQLDAPMWALTALAAAAIARRRAGVAAILLALAFAIKPTAIVAAMLMGATWPRVGLRLLPLMVFVLLVPFLCADWNYIARLYASLADRIHGAIQQRGHWIDIGSLLTVGMGLKIPFGVMLGIRAAIAAATLGITLAAREKLERSYAAFLAFAFAALYLLLFNPRTEGGGYAGLSLVAAPFAARMLLTEGKTLSAVLLVFVCIAMGITSLTHSTMAFFGSWFKPTIGILVTLFVLIPRAFNPRLFLPITSSPESLRGSQPPPL
jgi:alpha-1,2-mannosyltransferase